MALTIGDLKKIDKLLQARIQENNKTLTDQMVENNEVMMDYVKSETDSFRKELVDKIDHLPTKEEFYSRDSATQKKVQDVEVEVNLTTARSVENKDNIEKLNEAVFGN